MYSNILLDKIGSFSLWLMRLTYVNFLWIIFTFIGLGVFGFFPSTVGMFAIARKWVQGNHDINILGTFWHEYKNEFFKSNLLGYLIFIMGFILYIDLTVFEFEGGLLRKILHVILLSITFESIS